jgi:hypothetical protein
MTLYKQALRRASRAMFNARLIALTIDVELPHCDACTRPLDAQNIRSWSRRREAVAAAPRASIKVRAGTPPVTSIAVRRPGCGPRLAATAAANRSVRETDVRPHAVDRLRGRCPEIPAGAEQVDLHALAAGPGVPKLLRVERALGGARQLVERNTQMPTENHRQSWTASATAWRRPCPTACRSGFRDGPDHMRGGSAQVTMGDLGDVIDDARDHAAARNHIPGL